MPRKPRAIVLDSWAIMAYFEDEPAAEKVADIIAEAHEEDTPLFMSVVNAGEVRRVPASEAARGDLLTWKVAMWGSPRDARLIRSLARRLPTLERFCVDRDIEISEGSDCIFTR